MIVFIILGIVLVILFVVRFIRARKFFYEMLDSPAGKQKTIASVNFVLHILICLVLFFSVLGIIFMFYLAATGDV